eukprot:CAMPEP_0170475912 /NCGR_PEP_ID=MMETSP0123-20130129/17481_1 /TAXON_ID=182087 /ORGANISM="Favella ehrenbergii, Strain Fehren 1" /LENGTH=68 /DNA_ID=CAMNT_0010746733 /DNA_START=176 /DNA_END=382 /DNA_ORIENTATION=-
MRHRALNSDFDHLPSDNESEKDIRIGRILASLNQRVQRYADMGDQNSAQAANLENLARSRQSIERAAV